MKLILLQNYRLYFFHQGLNGCHKTWRIGIKNEEDRSLVRISDSPMIPNCATLSISSRVSHCSPRDYRHVFSLKLLIEKLLVAKCSI